MNTKTANIEQFLIAGIISGDFPPGTKIPSQHKLMQQFDCSRVTVLRALSNLCDSGFLRSNQGKGTFVNPGPYGSKLREIIVVSEYDSSFPFAEVLLNLDCDLPCRWVNQQFLSRNAEKFFSLGQVVIWMLPQESQMFLMNNLRNRGIPQLLINRAYDNFNHVTIDPKASIEEGVIKIIPPDSLQREIAVISRLPHTSAPYLAERLIAFYEVCSENNVTVPPGWIYKLAFSDHRENEIILNRIFEEQKNMPYRTFFIPEEVPLHAVILAASRFGLSLGRDYGILAFCQEMFSPSAAGFTIMHQPLEKFRHEVENFLRFVNDGNTGVFQVKLKTDLRYAD